MKLSAKGRYGIYAMFDLAQQGPEAPQPIKAIADRQGIPEAYLEQLMAVLRRAGLAQGVRGAQGGYLLARSPAEITVGDVLRALEGGLVQEECLTDGACDRAYECPTRLMWRKVHEGVNDIVDGITLKDMLDDRQRMLKGELAT